MKMRRDGSARDEGTGCRAEVLLGTGADGVSADAGSPHWKESMPPSADTEPRVVEGSWRTMSVMVVMRRLRSMIEDEAANSRQRDGGFQQSRP